MEIHIQQVGAIQISDEKGINIIIPVKVSLVGDAADVKMEHKKLADALALIDHIFYAAYSKPEFTTKDDKFIHRWWANKNAPEIGVYFLKMEYICSYYTAATIKVVNTKLQREFGEHVLDYTEVTKYEMPDYPISTY